MSGQRFDEGDLLGGCRLADSELLEVLDPDARDDADLRTQQVRDLGDRAGPPRGDLGDAVVVVRSRAQDRPSDVGQAVFRAWRLRAAQL